MSDRQIFRMAHEGARRLAVEAVKFAPEGWIVEVKPPTRSLAQNALLWAKLNDISMQVVWHGQRLTPDNWKDMATAALRRQSVVPGIDGGFVVLGERTRTYTTAEMGELLDFLDAFAAERGVVFSDSNVSPHQAAEA